MAGETCPQARAHGSADVRLLLRSYALVISAARFAEVMAWGARLDFAGHGVRCGFSKQKQCCCLPMCFNVPLLPLLLHVRLMASTPRSSCLGVPYAMELLKSSLSLVQARRGWDPMHPGHVQVARCWHSPPQKSLFQEHQTYFSLAMWVLWVLCFLLRIL